MHRPIQSVILLLGALFVAAPALAAPWLWDRNQDRIDDRIAAVHVNGLSAAHLNNDLNGRLRIFVFGTAPSSLAYGVYVGYDHKPTDADVAALRASGAVLLWRPLYINYLRARASYLQIEALASLPGITRVEAWQAMYGFNDIATRTLRVRDAEGGVGAGMFPSVWKDLGYTGKGIVVGILDSGVNDSPDPAYPTYPGHESLVGKFVGGGDFSNVAEGQNTPPDSSANPVDHGAAATEYHGSHVAGTAIGSGGPSGRYAGMAPGARLVDCKVITDGGVGGGAAEALDWCLHHRNTVWGTDPDGTVYRGVQVVNMSIGGMDASDGTDADCAAVNAAVKAGIVVCIATGNDGNTHYMPSPGAADLDIACGWLQDANSLQHSDDIVSDQSNEGPRDDDGDTDHLDEMKPSVLGSGSDIVSVEGDPASDGTLYKNINGTSMATPGVAGICALIRQANPALTPAQVREIIQNTAEHRTDHGQQPPSASDPFHIDPNYHPSWGWGEIDAYAAVKEALNAGTAQVVSEGTSGVSIVGGHPEIGIRWQTQREIGVTAFRVYRAPDLAGVAGDFDAVSPDVAPVGRPDIERVGNRTTYNYTDASPELVGGDTYWYQVRWTDTQGFTHREPAFAVRTDVRPVRARVQWVITHNAMDNDIFARFGSGVDELNPAFQRPCDGSTSADSFVVVVPVGFGGATKRFYFHTDLTDDDQVSGFLPPSNANPWFLSVHEQGYVNTEGLVDSFSVTTYDNAGNPTATYRAPNPTTPTVETQTTVFWIPSDPVAQPNHPPVFEAVGDRMVGQGLTLSFHVHANDPDGQTLTYSALGLPSGATFNASNQTFDWTPTFLQSGSFQLSFIATDDFLLAASDTERVTISVTPRAPGSNTVPVLGVITDKSTSVGVPLAFTVTATDAEGGPLAFSAGPLPVGASFDAGTRTLSWTPAPGSEGTYSTTVNVSDNGGAADSQSVTITVVPGTPSFPTECHPDTATIDSTIGVNAQGLNDVSNYHSFVVPPGTLEIRGSLSWSGGPAIDLDLYLIDPEGNVVGSGATATLDPENLLYVNPVPGVYKWQVASFDNANPSLAYTVTSAVCISDQAGVAPRGGVAFSMDNARPNPFVRTSMIRFSLPASGIARLKIYDIAGRVVRTLVDGPLQAGMHQRVWDGRAGHGGRALAGVYFARLEAGRGVRTQKMIMLR
jgi:subtilisin family serine protease